MPRILLPETNLADNFPKTGKIEIEIEEARPPGGLFIVQEPIMTTSTPQPAPSGNSQQ